METQELTPNQMVFDEKSNFDIEISSAVKN